MAEFQQTLEEYTAMDENLNNAPSQNRNSEQIKEHDWEVIMPEFVK